MELRKRRDHGIAIMEYRAFSQHFVAARTSFLNRSVISGTYSRLQLLSGEHSAPAGRRPMSRRRDIVRDATS